MRSTTNNRQRVDEALDLVREGLTAYFQWLIVSKFGEDEWDKAVALSARGGAVGNTLDVTRLVNMFHDYKVQLLNDAMGKTGVNSMHVLQEIRNEHMHQQPFSTPDTLRALDTSRRLLEIANEPKLAARVQKSYEAVMREMLSKQQYDEARKLTANINTQGSEGLIPWRQVITPHEDVRTGNLKEAEFAADLWQVHLGQAGPEYGDPQAFYRRTYLTEGLTTLLETAYRRLSQTGGDPVIELQTNFGGGKTHSMIALYHLTSCQPLVQLPGLEGLARQLGSAEPLCVQRAVLVGTELSLDEVRTKDDGTVVRTLWGELAWQLAGPAGYALVARSDESGLPPGAGVLGQLFDLAGPSLILIDEWVALLRPLYQKRQEMLAGSFDANLTFAQNLTEAVTATPGVLLAASLPESEIEAGGDGGKQALRILKNTFDRVKSSWRPASASESFEIVRRRLFEDVQDVRKRDATIRLFIEQYRQGKTLYPTKVHDADYRKRMEAAYPFHPELFDQLFEVWGSLDSFQRTRGVLRLMANVVSVLWQRNDASPLIMPANLPLDAEGVASEMGGYLPDSWTSVIAHDIDGDTAVSLMLDRENDNYNRVSATRRVARAIFLGSAPTNAIDGANKGIDTRSIRLGVVQPGERAEIFGDALRAYTTRATYLYSEHDRYWFSTQPSVTQVAQERKAQLRDDDVDHEIEQWLRKEQGKRGVFDRVHIAPSSSGDVADTPEVSLVIQSPGAAHVSRQLGNGAEASPAIRMASTILESRGDGKRVHRNGVLFLAADHKALESLRDAMKDWLVWKGIVDSREALNLNAQQLRQSETRRDDAARTVESRIQEAWCWLLSPHQKPTPGSPVEWEQVQVKNSGSGDSLAVAAGKRALSDEKVVEVLSPLMLRQQIEEIPAFENGWTHIRFGDLQNWYADYLYLYRLKDPVVLANSVRAGIDQMFDSEAYFFVADGYDEASERYLGLKAGHKEALLVQLTRDSRLVQTGIAMKQRRSDEEAERARERDGVGDPENGTGVVDRPGSTSSGGDGSSPPIVEVLPKRYFGSVTINPQTMASSVS
ncbi:MAG: DUF499 domain-containing protein, partial [Thermomicrobiales bacterium]|nr:DUF499 domain-containing protein [Thermomicrobiales bacterium]